MDQVFELFDKLGRLTSSSTSRDLRLRPERRGRLEVDALADDMTPTVPDDCGSRAATGC